MKRQLSDEQLDRLMRGLLNESAADDATVNQVADSPATWWAVQKQINQQKDSIGMPWPPMPKLWRLLLIGIPVAAAVIFAVTFFAIFPGATSTDQARTVEPAVYPQTKQIPVTATEIETPVRTGNGQLREVKAVTHEQRKVIASKSASYPKSAMAAFKPSTSEKSAEIKTDFIALSYARNPESGQIVRVRVPSSMMVTLGLVGTVEKPSRLVDAEVLVGDDGLTHSIRFIR